MENDQKRCPRCGATLDAGGACRRCLLALGLSEGLASADGEPTPAASAEAPGGLPERIGPFRVLGILGAGGMGVVYLAEPGEAGRRPVALRVVRPRENPEEVLRRFEAARLALAVADQPGVAKALAAGVAEDGRLYLATERVPGVPVTEYCDRERLTVRQRLELFVEVCEAVQHAHTQGVLHRNLKASNVLVTHEGGRPRPRVVDFGVATALGQEPTGESLFTAASLLQGGPGHTSPEQLGSTGSGVDARADVYSLGALLYELLAGAPPFDPRRLRRAAWEEVARVIQQDEPPRPSTRVITPGQAAASEAAMRRRTEPRGLAGELRGDLDWITLKALEKDPGNRHQSADELRADIHRHLRGEAVVPGLPGLWSRLRRWARHSAREP